MGLLVWAQNEMQARELAKDECNEDPEAKPVVLGCYRCAEADGQVQQLEDSAG